jgi:hypothetical protein
MDVCLRLPPRYELLCARTPWKRRGSWLLLGCERESFSIGIRSLFWQSSVSRSVFYSGTGMNTHSNTPMEWRIIASRKSVILLGRTATTHYEGVLVRPDRPCACVAECPEGDLASTWGR